MRLDKFLKNSRIIKRRTVAKEACDKGRIQVNGTVAKAGTTVAENDEITIRLGERKTTVVVTKLIDSPTKDQASLMYRQKEE